MKRISFIWCDYIDRQTESSYSDLFLNQRRYFENFWAMLNKIYEWIETSFANLRNGVPAAEHSDAHQAPGDGQMRRKRPIEWYELLQRYSRV